MEAQEVECWTCGRHMPADMAAWVAEPNADGTGFAEVQAGSCAECLARTDAALDADEGPR